ncbi:MAG: NAD(P)H-dependent oxidoreductase subunit E [Burkholderiales bacterium]|nr:NAD(P)H-dependent oxidoreductase subunit E [Burkholderiales bacterium]
MNHPVIPIAVQGATRQRKRQAPKGRRVDAQALAEVQAALGDEPLRRDRLIEYLHRLNDRHGQLGTPHLAALAQQLRLAQTEVFEVATFYHHFEVVREDADGRVPAAPELTVRVCDGLACEMSGARTLLDRLPALLGASVRVIAAPCIGRCEQAPAVAVHQHPLAAATADTVLAAVRAGHRTHEPAPWIDLADYGAGGGYALLRECVQGQRSADSVIAVLEAAGLRGLGGAGFPAGRKWRLVRNEPAPRLMAVNIDEGEPGTFKDRWLLERDPHRFLEGVLIAAWAVGIDAVYIYLRDEYHGCRALLEAELARLRAAPPLADVPGWTLPVLELRRGAGAYICGEESAMIESIEGKRGLPRLRPPYVAQVGLFGRPTLEHNFETLYWVRELLERGGEWFAAQGRHGRQGLRRFSVSGRVREPGVKLAPAGITLRELVDEFCGGMLPGHTLYAYLPGGASGGILPARLADVPLDFDTLQPYGCFIGSAAVIVLSQHDRAVDAARNLMRFFEHESCGQCTPCRNGTAKARALIEQAQWDLPLLADLSQVMRDASICGLGQAAPNPVDCVVKYFPEELERP